MSKSLATKRALLDSNPKLFKAMRAIFLLLLVVSSIFLPALRTPAQVPPEVAKYLKNGESIVAFEELTFWDTPEFNLTAYKLSSGALLLFSKKYNAVVLGDEWTRIPDGDHLALQFYTAYYFSKEEEVNFEIPMDYNWYKGVDLYNDYINKRLMQIAGVMLAIGVISVIITGGATALFLIGYAAGVASALNTFINNLGLKVSNTPRAYLALVILKPKAPEDMKSIYETLDKLEEHDKEGATHLKTIANMSVISRVYDYSGWWSFITLAFISKAGLLDDVARTVGEDKIASFISLFITRNKVTAREFLHYLRDWSSSTDPHVKLNAIRNIENILSGLIIKAAVSASLSYLGRYLAVEAQKDRDSLVGFFGLHCLLLGDLRANLNTFGYKLRYGIIAPTVDNVLTFYGYKLIYYDLRDELFEGLEKYDLKDLHDTGILSIFIPDRKENLQEAWRDLLSREKNKGGEVSKEAIKVLVAAAEAFEKFKNDMASRRRAPAPDLGLDLVLVVDVSGSMEDSFKGMRKIDAAILAASDFTKLVSPRDRVALVKFSSRASIVKELTYNKQEILDALSSLRTGGDTALGDGLWLALDILERRSETRPAAVILLTDGMHNAGIRSPGESAERARNLGIRVFTLGFGGKGDIDENTLKNIASVTGGAYYYAPSPDELRKIYAMLSGAVSGHMSLESFLGILKQGEVKEIPINVPAGEGYFSVRVSYSGSRLELAARSPSGVDLDLTSSNVIYYEEKGFAQLTVYRPEPGQWKVMIKAIETAPQGVEYSAVVLKPGFTAELTRSLLYVSEGSSNETKIIVKALRDLPYIKAQLPPTLSSYATIQPSLYTNIKAGNTYEFTVKIVTPPYDVSDAILIQSLDSVAWLNIQVRTRGLLTLAISSPPPEIREGKQILAKLWVLDERGITVPDASLKASSRGIALPLAAKEDFYLLNATGLKPGRHIIEIEASKPGYKRATASILVHVLLKGDINKDDIVDYRDIAILVASYGMTGNLVADINEDKVIDYKDIAITIYNYGRKA